MVRGERHLIISSGSPANAAPRADRGRVAGGRSRAQTNGKLVRLFKDFTYATLDSWSRSRRVIGKAEHLDKGANLRFIVTSLEECCARTLYEKIKWCPRRDGESYQGMRARPVR